MPGSLDPGRVKQEQSPGEDGKKTHVTVNLLSAEMASIQSNEAVKHFVYFLLLKMFTGKCMSCYVDLFLV